MSDQVRINLGCGNRKMPGFINVDAREEVNPDVIDDVGNPQMAYPPADLVYACHVLEHFKRSEIVSVLKRWRALLKPGGILRLSVPDLKEICIYHVHTLNLKALENLLYGSQKHNYDFHYTGFDWFTLTDALKEAGFDYNLIRRWDWRKTDHANFDDYSQAYLPHMDKENGRHMSLNMEAVR